MKFGGVQPSSLILLHPALPLAAGGVVLTKPRRWGSGLAARGRGPGERACDWPDGGMAPLWEGPGAAARA